MALNAAIPASRYFALVFVLPTWWERIGYFAVSHAGFSIIHLQARHCAKEQSAWLYNAPATAHSSTMLKRAPAVLLTCQADQRHQACDVCQTLPG